MTKTAREVIASPDPVRLGPLPYTTPEVPSLDFEGNQRDTSALTIATTAATAVICGLRANSGLDTTVGVTGEKYRDGTRTGDAMIKDLTARGVSRSEVKPLGPGGSTYSQLASLKKWGVNEIIAHESHAGRVSEILENVGMNAGVVAVNEVLELPEAEEFIGRNELQDLLNRTRAFDERNPRYEAGMFIRLFTAMTALPGGLRLAAGTSGAAQKVAGMNSVDVPGDEPVWGRRR